MVGKLALVLAASLTLTETASAAVISFSTIFDMESVLDTPLETSGDAFGEYSTTFFDLAFLELPRFDSGLGVLQDVSIVFETQTRMRFQIRAVDREPDRTFCPVPPDFTCPVNDTFNRAHLTGGFRAELFDPGGADDGTGALRAVFCEDVAETDAVCVSELRDIVEEFNFSLPLDGIGLSEFMGTDPIHMFVRLQGLLDGECDFDDGGDLCSVFPGTGLEWTGGVTVKYTFEPRDGGADPEDPGAPVPEPTSLLLLATGGLALLAKGRRRRTQHTQAPQQEKRR